jgi:S-DNA-T family DNA segregation ATPase FtsK/SpoIIIE
VADFDGPLSVVVGLEDKPAEQTQADFTFDISGGGALIVGGPSSGKSTALRTVGAALAQGFPPELVHIHGIDAGTGQLLALEALPHAGVIAGIGEPERVDRLLEVLADEVSRRLEILQRCGASDLREQWKLEPARRLPWLVLLIDGWERAEGELRDRDAERTWRLLQRVAGEGRSAGIVPLIAGSWRTVLASCPFSDVGERWVLRYPTASEHQLVDIRHSLVPPGQPKGRALLPGRTFRHDGDRAIAVPGLVQLAVVGGDASGAAQAAALASLARTLPWSSPDSPPARIDRLPPRITLRDAIALDHEGLGPSDPYAQLPALVGVGSDRLRAHYFDVGATPAFVVAGPEKSGRTSTLLTVGWQMAASGATLILVHPRGSLSPLQSHPSTIGSYSGAAAVGIQPAEQFEAAAGPCVLIIDDADGLQILVDALRPSPGSERKGVIVGALPDTLREYWFHSLLAGRSGIVLHPRGAYDGEQLGRRLTYSTVITVPKGRGHLLASGEDILVQIPLYE